MGVQRCGDNAETWKSLLEQLNRNPRFPQSIRHAYIMTLAPTHQKIGRWNIKEDEILLAYLFKIKHVGRDVINSVVLNDFKNLTELKRNYRHIASHYEGLIKPILLGYTQGRLYTSYKYEFLSYVVENGIISEKEVQWNQVLRDFPSQTRISLKNLLGPFKAEGPQDQVPLHEKVRKNLRKYKNHQFSKKKKNIVMLLFQSTRI